MSAKHPVHAGACRCGQIGYQVQGKPLVTMACHCTGCQKMTASAFSLSSLYPADRFAITQGEPVIGGLHGDPRHYFCPHCMSWLFTRMPGLDHLVNVRAPLLDDAPAYRPFLETYTAEAFPWAKTGAVHSFDKYPKMEAFQALIAEYAST